jgi:hypothetical protein
MKLTVLLGSLVILVSCCATGIGRLSDETALERYQPYLGAPIDRFVAFRFDSWESVGRNQLVIWTRFNEAYLIKVWDTCRDLVFAQRIGIKSTGSSVTRFDSVRVGPDSCPIEEIRPIDIAYRADQARTRAAPK